MNIYNTYNINNITGDIVNTFNEGGLDPVTDWSGQGGGVKVTLPSSALIKPYQYMFQKVCQSIELYFVNMSVKNQ